jgi:ribosomal protein S18 acetylase RimI-like enzyme
MAEPGTGCHAGAARRAGPADARALVRLRALMLHEMGAATGGEDAPWRAAAEAWFAARLADREAFAAFVVDDPDLGPMSCAVGLCDLRAPGPASLSGLRGHVFNVATDPRHRRRGHARACVSALMGWFRDETAAEEVDLNATGPGSGLYRSLGFDVPRHPALRARIER